MEILSSRLTGRGHPIVDNIHQRSASLSSIVLLFGYWRSLPRRSEGEKVPSRFFVTRNTDLPGIFQSTLVLGEERDLDSIERLVEFYSIGESSEEKGLQESPDDDEWDKPQDHQCQRPTVDERQNQSDAEIRHIL